MTAGKHASEQESEVERQSLKDAVQQTLDEARMVLPGIQALFGFQLIAIFNQRFSDALSPVGQYLHLTALVSTALAIALVMTPAAYHRQREQRKISATFLRRASAFVAGAMLPLAVGLALDLYVVALLVSDSHLLSCAIAGGLTCVLFGLWWVYPRLGHR